MQGHRLKKISGILMEYVEDSFSQKATQMPADR